MRESILRAQHTHSAEQTVLGPAERGSHGRVQLQGLGQVKQRQQSPLQVAYTDRVSRPLTPARRVASSLVFMEGGEKTQPRLWRLAVYGDRGTGMNLFHVSATEQDHPSGLQSISIPPRHSSLLTTTENRGEGGSCQRKAPDRSDPCERGHSHDSSGAWQAIHPPIPFLNIRSHGPSAVQGWENHSEQKKQKPRPVGLRARARRHG